MSEEQYNSGSVCELAYPGLFIGSDKAARKYHRLRKKGITGIVCAGRGLVEYFPKSFKYLCIDLLDDGSDNLLKEDVLPRVVGFVDSCLESHGRVLIHCQAGVSRSSALCVAYIMMKWHLTFDISVALVKEKYFLAEPADNFVEQLCVLEKSKYKYYDENGGLKGPIRHYCLQYRGFTSCQGSNRVGEGKKHTEPLCVSHASEDRIEIEIESVGLSEDVVESSVSKKVLDQQQGEYKMWCVALEALYASMDVLGDETPKSKVAALLKNPSYACPTSLPILYLRICKKYEIEKVNNPWVLDQLRAKYGEALSKSSDPPLATMSFCCFRCRRPLATEEFVIHSGPDCSSLFVEPLRWMPKESREGVQGKLICPGCGSKAGQFRWQGLKCGCGQWVAPAFALVSSKLDKRPLVPAEKDGVSPAV